MHNSHGVGFKMCARWVLRSSNFPWRGWALQMYTLTLGTTKPSGPKKKECPILYLLWLSRQYNGDKDSLNKLYTLITYVPNRNHFTKSVTTFKYLYSVNENWPIMSSKAIKLPKRKKRKQKKLIWEAKRTQENAFWPSNVGRIIW